MADECDVKKNGAWTPSRIRKQTACNCKSAESRSWSSKVCFVLWVHCDFDLMSFLEREVKEQEDGVVVGVGSPLAEQPLPLISTEKSTPWQNPRCPKSKFLAVERDKVLPRCPKSTLSKIRRCQKKKSKFGGNLTRSGVRVRGLGLVWTSALTRSDRDQGQTRSRTRHRNLTRLVSHVLLTSLVYISNR